MKKVHTEISNISYFPTILYFPKIVEIKYYARLELTLSLDTQGYMK